VVDQYLRSNRLLSPGLVLLKHHVCTSKSDPLVEEVQLLHANPQYSHVPYGDGRETTVSRAKLQQSSLVPATPVTPTTSISLSEVSVTNMPGKPTLYSESQRVSAPMLL